MVATIVLCSIFYATGAVAIPIITARSNSPSTELKYGPGNFGHNSGSHAFNVKAIPNPVYKPNGKIALARVLEKYQLEMPESIKNLSRGADGSLIAEPGESDVEYVCSVTLGGSQKLNLNFDTGSSDFWVFSSLLPKSTQEGHEIYTPGSTAQQLPNAKWEIRYGDGLSASGMVVRDLVAVGNTAVKNQAIGLAEKISETFKNDTFSDGIVGLGFGTGNTVTPHKQKTFLENAAEELTLGVMAVDLRHQESGLYEFGTIDPKKYTGDILYAPVDGKRGYWQFPATSYTINNNTWTEKATAIADTGSSLLLMSNQVAEDYYASVKGSMKDEIEGGYIFPCSAELPDITLSIGNNKAIVPGSWMNLAPIAEDSDICFGALQGYDGDTYIYGDVFFKAFFTVFDYDNRRFGFAAKAL